MIRFYCQYSFGGFRTFRIYGEENEALANQEVDKDNLLDFPPQCNLYFNYGGAKLLFRTLPDGSSVIALRDIPGVEKDTDGRPINCALQIVGDEEDLPVMRNIVLAIVNDVDKFQTDFTDGFSFRNGLHYDGRILADFAKSLEGITLGAPETDLADFSFRNGPVYLFVPTSPLFQTDGKLAAKVISELQLGSTREDTHTILKNTIANSSLSNLAGKVVAVSEEISVSNETETETQILDEKKEEETDEEKEEEADKTEEETVEEKVTLEESKTATTDADDNNADKLRIIDLERELETARDAKDKAEHEKKNLEQKVDEQKEAMRRTKRIMTGLAVGAVAVTAAFIISLFVK